MDGPDLPPPSRAPSPAHAIDLIAELVEASAEPVTLVPVGPLTNIALFLARYPEVAQRVGRVVLMGGTTGFGNLTPNAEFNIWADPDAARRVFMSGLDVTMVGLDATHDALLTFAQCDRLRTTGEAGRLVAELVDFYARSHVGWTGTPIHDAVAVAHVVDPTLLTLVECHVDVDCGPVGGGAPCATSTATAGFRPRRRLQRGSSPASGSGSPSALRGSARARPSGPYGRSRSRPAPWRGCGCCPPQASRAALRRPSA